MIKFPSQYFLVFIRKIKESKGKFQGVRGERKRRADYWFSVNLGGKEKKG
jgi:hypothetical protein